MSVLVFQKFAGRGAGGVSGVGGEGPAAGRGALAYTVTARFTHGRPGQGRVGSAPERPSRTQKTQTWHQKGGIVTEWLLRTQDGQDRDHKRHGLLGLEQRSDGRFPAPLLPLMGY